jgi:hypothetical protein
MKQVEHDMEREKIKNCVNTNSFNHLGLHAAQEVGGVRSNSMWLFQPYLMAVICIF